MRISSPSTSNGVSPTTNFDVARKYSDQSLQAVAESITKRVDIETLSVTICALYLDTMQRVSDARSNSDRVRGLKAGNDPRWKQAMREARFACKDEEKMLRLVDRVIRGLCECMGTRTRFSYQTMSEINACKYPDPSEQLRKENTRLLFRNLLLTKAILYGLTLPTEYLSEDLDDELKAYVDDKIKKARIAKV
jgi:hypothetical protein